MPEWLDMLIQSSKTNLTNICLDSVNIFINILRYNDKSNIRGGGALMNIQRLIADPRNKSGKFSEHIMANPMGFKQEILNELQNSDQVDEESQKSGHTHCKEIIQNLWQLLEQESDTENIVRHLKEFDMLVPRIFCDVVIEDLRNKQNREKQDLAIKKFATFWKYTAYFYPNYMPFKTEIRGKKYLALHNMINFLEDPDPTLRLSCRSWLSQNRQFNRILDPIIEEFIKYSNFKTVGNMTVIDGDFDTQYVIENFGKLRNIILNSQDDIIEYILVKTCQGHIISYYCQKYNKQHGYDAHPTKGGSFIDPATAALQPGPDANVMRTSTVGFAPGQAQNLMGANMGPG